MHSFFVYYIAAKACENQKPFSKKKDRGPTLFLQGVPKVRSSTL